MPDKTAGRPVARPKVRLTPRVIAREKQILPMANAADVAGAGPGNTRSVAPASYEAILWAAQSSAESNPSLPDKRQESTSAHQSDIQSTTKIPRLRTEKYILAEQFALSKQQDDIRPALEDGHGVLRSARGWLKELRDSAPPHFLSFPKEMAPIGKLNATLREVSAWVRKMRKNMPPSIGQVPRKRGKMNPDLILDLISGSIDVIQQVTNRLDAEAHAKLVANQIKIVSELEKKVEALEKLDRELEAQKGDLDRERKALPPEN